MEPGINESDGPVDFEQWQLLAYIDGAVDAQTALRIEARLRMDPVLAAEVSELADAQARLAERLAGGPSSHELGEYALGLLSPEGESALERRLARDPDARRRLEDLTAYLDAPNPRPLAQASEPGEAVARRIRLLVAELVAGFDALSTGGPLTVAPAGVRGEASRALTYAVGDAQLIIEFEASADDRTKRDGLGLLVGFEQPQALTASLYRLDDLVARATLDELGNFTFSALEPAAYQLILRSDTLEIAVPEIRVT